MAIKKIYTDGKAELEVFWDKDGIYLELSTNDMESSLIITLDDYEATQLSDDLECFAEAVNDEQISNKIKKKLESI